MIYGNATISPSALKTVILQDENGNEVAAGVVVKSETVFTATTNDVREGKVFASDSGVATGTKVIPSYHTTQGYKIITNGEPFVINLPNLDSYDYTKLQAIFCEFNTNLSDSVSATKVSIDGKVYEVLSTVVTSEVNKNHTDKTVEFGIENTSGKNYLLRFFTYKEIE